MTNKNDPIIERDLSALYDAKLAAKVTADGQETLARLIENVLSTNPTFNEVVAEYEKGFLKSFAATNWMNRNETNRNQD